MRSHGAGVCSNLSCCLAGHLLPWSPTFPPRNTCLSGDMCKVSEMLWACAGQALTRPWLPLLVHLGPRAGVEGHTRKAPLSLQNITKMQISPVLGSNNPLKDDTALACGSPSGKEG